MLGLFEFFAAWKSSALTSGLEEKSGFKKKWGNGSLWFSMGF